MPAGPAVQLVPAAPAQALERADDVVDGLLEAGRSPGDILVLTVGGPHPWQLHELSFGEGAYWAQLGEGGDVFYADADTTRPVRREVVVLVVNDTRPARIEQAARKALGHAAALLVVCGDTAAAAPALPEPSDRPVPA
ncbi:hypothetical protein AB0D08_06210 [Kitasatospora sp. NPDC048540]|uniref:hypothetical protein n=1 Tax=unclassified Kitasatospora TaxID=2633591 RepID=UPI000AF7D02B|nr:hypothetical protein [Kitasatospora sp. MBT63]